MDPWPHQTRTVAQVESAIDDGCRRLVFTVPTGGGKTWIMEELTRRALDRGWPVALYTNRNFLREQLSRNLLASGLEHGVRAAGEDDERERPFQICSVQTEHSRAMVRKKWPLHPAKLVLVDEGHVQTGPKAKAIWAAHQEQGAAVVFSTATPLGMAEVADRLIVGATMGELRRCGACVPAVHYGPDEPDWRAFKGLKEGTLPTEKQNAQAMAPARIFGRVFPNFIAINPELRPFILFGPDVEGSLWYAEQFTYPERRHESLRGLPAVRCGHVDGDDVWLDGELHRSTPELRAELLRESKAGKLAGICNRFVMREGIDAPWIAHLVFATVFGSLQSYLQSGGRGLRSCDGKDHCTVQDHGGNWWRHGSLNEDRVWEIDQDAEIAGGLRAERIRQHKQAEPFRCPGCGRIWTAGKTCSTALGGCGYVLGKLKRSRPVITAEGTLKEYSGAIFKPHRISTRTDGPRRWERMFWRSRTAKGQRTFRAAMVLFAQENNWGWPDPGWPLMPTNDRDLFRLVEDVPFDRLTSVPERTREKELFSGQG